MDKFRAQLVAQGEPKSHNFRRILVGHWEGHQTLNASLRSKRPETLEIGRTVDCDVIILDVNISRRHASITYNKDIKQWNIKDNKSLNGVKVNNIPIVPSCEHPLNDGDLITVGPGSDYEWKFDACLQEENKVLHQVFKVPNSPMEDIADTSLFKSKVNERLKEANLKISSERRMFEEKVENGRKIQELLKTEKDQLEKKLDAKREQFEREQKIERENFERTLSANQEENEKLRNNFELRLQEEKSEMLKKSEIQEEEMRKKIETEECRMKELLLERDKMIELLQSEKEKAEKKIDDERKCFEEKVKTLEGTFRNIEKEKCQEYQDAIKKLHQEFEDKTRQNQLNLEEAIAKEKAEKEAEREEKEKMMKELEHFKSEFARIEDEKSSKRKQSEDETRVKKKLKKENQLKLFSKCSEELKCTICDDLFISPMSLTCGHVYCKFCLDQWKVKCRSGGFTCPNCRSKITTQTKSLHLENLIESLFADASEEVKKERAKQMDERKEKCGNRPPVPPQLSQNWRTPGGRGQDQAQQSIQPPNAPAPPPLSQNWRTPGGRGQNQAQQSVQPPTAPAPPLLSQNWRTPGGRDQNQAQQSVQNPNAPAPPLLSQNWRTPGGMGQNQAHLQIQQQQQLFPGKCVILVNAVKSATSSVFTITSKLLQNGNNNNEDLQDPQYVIPMNVRELFPPLSQSVQPPTAPTPPPLSQNWRTPGGRGQNQAQQSVQPPSAPAPPPLSQNWRTPGGRGQNQAQQSVQSPTAPATPPDILKAVLEEVRRQFRQKRQKAAEENLPMPTTVAFDIKFSP